MGSCQNDSDLLTFPEWQHAVCTHALNTEAFRESITPRPDAPVQNISDEVCDCQEAWETFLIKRAFLSAMAEPMDLEHNYVHEPLRPMTDSAPPRCFYRTFWRSAARRIMLQQQEVDMQYAFSRTTC